MQGKLAPPEHVAKVDLPRAPCRASSINAALYAKIK
jgi:hypothetical protein